MCRDCGCATSTLESQTAVNGAIQAIQKGSRTTIHVVHRLMEENDRVAAHNRSHLSAHGILAINLMSSPGSGKTSLLESTIRAIGKLYRIAVIEGDLETELDALRIRKQGVPAVQITTGGGCHLDAHMIHEALHALELSKVDILFIENVGNLVCPAAFDLGQNINVALLSTTEGDDKPAKYPILFHNADLVLLSKCDLMHVMHDFSVERAETHIRKLANSAQIFSLSSRSGVGIDLWTEWLIGKLTHLRRQSECSESRLRRL